MPRFPPQGGKCIAGDRESRIEGAISGRDQVFSRVEQEANWQVKCDIRLATRQLGRVRICMSPRAHQVPHLNPGVLSLYDFKSSKFIITFKKMEELDGWHPVFGKTVYGFDVLRAISDEVSRLSSLGRSALAQRLVCLT